MSQEAFQQRVADLKTRLDREITMRRRAAELGVPFDTPAEHPMRCQATTDLGGDHTHACTHPAPSPHQTAGVPEHLCHCGARWWEPKTSGRPAPVDLSWVTTQPAEHTGSRWSWVVILVAAAMVGIAIAAGITGITALLT